MKRAVQNGPLGMDPKELAQILRSESTHPAVQALANAIDPGVYSTMRLVKALPGRQPRWSTVFKWLEKGPLILAAYEEGRAQRLSSAEALAAAAKDNGVNEGDAKRMMADARANRDTADAVRRAMDEGLPIKEIARLAVTPPKRKRGPRPARE